MQLQEHYLVFPGLCARQSLKNILDFVFRLTDLGAAKEQGFFAKGGRKATLATALEEQQVDNGREPFSIRNL